MREPFTPVLPPMLESTIASRVVGTATRRTPRSHVAAARPARSPTIPPPTAITTPPRSIRFRSMNASRSPSADSDFERSLAGTTYVTGLTRADFRVLATSRAHGRTLVSVTMTTLVGSRRAKVGLSTFIAPAPMCTGYVPPGVSTISRTIGPARRSRRRRVSGRR